MPIAPDAREGYRKRDEEEDVRGLKKGKWEEDIEKETLRKLYKDDAQNYRKVLGGV